MKMNFYAFLYKTNKLAEKHLFKFNNKDTETMFMFVVLVYVLLT